MPKSSKCKKEGGAGSHGCSSRPKKKRLKVESSGEESGFLIDTEEEEEGQGAGMQGQRRQEKRQGESKRVRGAEARGRSKERQPQASSSTSSRGERSKESNSSTILRLRAKVRRYEAEKRRLEEKLSGKRTQLSGEREKLAIQERRTEKLRKEAGKLKVKAERLEREKEGVAAQGREEAARLRKKADGVKAKFKELELESVKLKSELEAKSAIISQQKEAVNEGASGSWLGGAGGPPGGLFQDMMDNFRELAETQLQCAVCSELFIEATSINCGHTFCAYCIGEWKKKKANCPVCRTDIKQTAACKVLDDYVDKMFDQFVSAGGRQQRQALKEERLKLKKDLEATTQARNAERRERQQARRAGGLEMVNIVLNRARNRARVVGGGGGDTDDSDIDSDATLELHLSDVPQTGPESDSDTSVPGSYQRATLDESNFLSETDSSDLSFRSDNDGGNDTDSVSESASDSEGSASDTTPLVSSDSDSDSDSD